MKEFILITIGVLAILCLVLCCIILVREVYNLWTDIKEYREQFKEEEYGED